MPPPCALSGSQHPITSLPSLTSCHPPSAAHSTRAPSTGQQLELSKQAVAPAVAAGGVLGLVATRTVEKGRELLSVPESLWLTVHTVAKSELGSFLAPLEPWLQVRA